MKDNNYSKRKKVLQVIYYRDRGHIWRRIIPHFPPHRTYVEPFGGVASVMLNKPPSPVEVYHDIIEDFPWQVIVAKYDTPETLFYCDPQYAYEMTVEEHQELAETLNIVKGHVVLFGYSSPEYDELYAGWKRVEFGVVECSRLKRNGNEHTSRLEVLWIKPAT